MLTHFSNFSVDVRLTAAGKSNKTNRSLMLNNVSIVKHPVIFTSSDCECSQHRRNALATARCNYYTQSTSVLSSRWCKIICTAQITDFHFQCGSAAEMTLIQTRQRWKKECGQARTCPMWSLASQKRPAVCTALLSEFVHTAVCVWICMCQQHLQSTAFIAHIPLTVQMAERYSPFLRG